MQKKQMEGNNTEEEFRKTKRRKKSEKVQCENEVLKFGLLSCDL